VSAFREYSNVKLREVRLGDFLLAVADASAAVYVRRRFMSELRPLPLQDIYGYVIQERDLIWRLMYIFDRTWPRAREVLTWDMDRRSYPRSFLVFARALEELERLLNAGYRPLVKVEGYMIKTGEEVTLTGVASSVRLSEDVTAFVLESGGTRYSVGGFDAELEDVEATRVTIMDITK